MPDNKKKVGKADRSRVAVGEVKDALKKVGNSRAALTKHFRGK
jgi:hypothetical protein